MHTTFLTPLTQISPQDTQSHFVQHSKGRVCCFKTLTPHLIPKRDSKGGKTIFICPYEGYLSSYVCTYSYTNLLEKVDSYLFCTIFSEYFFLNSFHVKQSFPYTCTCIKPYLPLRRIFDFVCIFLPIYLNKYIHTCSVPFLTLHVFS